MQTDDITLPAGMAECITACLATSQVLRQHQAAFTSSSSALAQLMVDWSRRQLVHHFRFGCAMPEDQAIELSIAMMDVLAAQAEIYAQVGADAVEAKTPEAERMTS